MYIASVQCLLHFGRAFATESLYPRYVRLYSCVTQEREVIISVGAYWKFFSSRHKSWLIFESMQRAGKGFQGAGSSEAKRRVCLAFEVTLQRYAKSNCTRSGTVFCHQRTAESTVLM